MFVFFFKQKTAYEMRISDWSSDVCSSDLGGVLGVGWRSNGHGNGQRSGEGMLHRGNTSSNGTPKPTRPTIPPTHDQRHKPAPHTGARPPTAPLDPANPHHRPVAPLPQSGRGVGGRRSEERRGGKEGVSRCRFRWVRAP